MSYNNSYNRANRGYSQSSSLNSGISFTDNDSIASGLHSLVGSLAGIINDKNVEEEQSQEQFNKLVDVSLKGVNGKYRDEAVKLRDDFLKKATGLARETQGQFTWDQTKKLEQERDNLNGFTGMYKDVQDWAKTAMAKTLSIKDPEAQAATIKNITDILENSPDLKTTWERTNSPDWLVIPKNKYDLKKDVLPKLPTILNKDGKPDIEGYRRASKALLSIDDPALTWYKQKWQEQNPDGTDAEFINQLAETKARYVQPKYTDPSIIPTPSNGGINAKGKYYNYSGRTYMKGDSRPVIKPNSAGNYYLGTDPIKLSSWQNDKGLRYNNAKIVEIKKVKGKYVAVIQHDKYYEDKDKADYIAKNGKEAWDTAVMSGIKKEPTVKKDQVELGTITVPLDKVYNEIGRHVVLKDIKANAVDISGLNKLLNKNVKKGDKKNPLGLDLGN